MRAAKVFFNNVTLAGILRENIFNQDYEFEYDSEYKGPPISLTMPTKQSIYHFSTFPTYFEGLLPEGFQLEALLKLRKIDRSDYFGQLLTVGKDLVGAFSIEEV